MNLWLDLETYNEVTDLKAVGVYRYAEDAEILLFAYAVDEAAPRVWDLTAGEPMPAELTHALAHADEITAQNANFDRVVLRAQGPRYGIQAPALERWRCTMAWSLSHALPGGLSEMCEVLQVPEDKAKLKEGKRLVGLFCKAQPANRKVRRATRHTHPAEWARFKAYAANDIEAMRESARRLPTWNWNASAIAEWHLDQRINDRGFHVDRELTSAGARAAVAEKERIGARFRELTGGVVDRPSQRQQLMDFLNARFGLYLDNTRGDTFNQLMKPGDLPAQAVELMQLSIASNKTSTAKYAKLHPSVCRDGRFRGAVQFAGAGRTRRWAGRGPQFHNLPSRGLPPAEKVEQYIEALKRDMHDLFFDDLMLYGAAALRGTVISPIGRKLVVADLSNIEGRMLAWLANERWKLQAFRDFDAGIGPDLYNITAVSIIGGDPWQVEKKNRNVFGKVPDLASGYRGGVAGYQTFARAYGVRMADHWDTIQKMIAPRFIIKAHENLAKWGRDQLDFLEISELEWIASETCKLAWRARHPATVKLWYDIQDACVNAIRNWGETFTAGLHLRMRCVTHLGQRWLLIRLPSGRYLTYFDPAIERDGTLTYWGEATEEGKTTRMWVKCFTHGGKITGNCCQTLARDQLAATMPEAEARGYPLVLTVHDEDITETPDTDDYSAATLSAIIATNQPWNRGLPLAAAGFEAGRYKKE
jgi:DNA polymerase